MSISRFAPGRTCAAIAVGIAVGVGGLAPAASADVLAPAPTTNLCSLMAALCPSVAVTAGDSYLDLQPTLQTSANEVFGGTAILNSLDLDLDGYIDGPSLEDGGFGFYAVDDLKLGLGVDNDLAAFLSDLGTAVASGGAGGAPAVFVTDYLRLSGQASLDGLLGLEAFGSRAGLVDALRLSAQAENGAVASVLEPGGPAAFLADSFRSSGTTISAALEGLASADVLGVQASAVDSLRLNGQASNDLVGMLLDPSGLAYASDVFRTSGPTLTAALDGLAGVEAFGSSAYLLDSFRVSSSLQNVGVAGLLGSGGGLGDLAFLADQVQLGNQAQALDVAGISTPLGGADVLDALSVDGPNAEGDILADILSDTVAGDLTTDLTALGTGVLSATTADGTTSLVEQVGAIAVVEGVTDGLNLVLRIFQR